MQATCRRCCCAGASEAIWLEEGGSVVGLSADAEYVTASISLEPGDLLVLYTDGLTEAQNPSGEEFTRRRLLDYVREHSNEPAQSLLDGLCSAVLQFTRMSPLRDDLTLVVVRATAP